MHVSMSVRASPLLKEQNDWDQAAVGDSGTTVMCAWLPAVR